jgi:3-hydroxyisobutyrate dehydrogenase
MGAPMAQNLARAGFEVRVWNRSPEKAEALAGDGVVPAGSPAEALAGAHFLVTMLADGPAIEEALDGGALDGFDGLWLQMSTIGVAAEERVRSVAERRGIGYVDAPVLGSRIPAENGELVVLAAGDDAVVDRAAAVFDVVGRETKRIGEAGSATRLKLVVNLWVLAVTEAAAEAVALAEGLGVDPRLFLDAMKGTAIDSPYLHLKGEAILEGRWDPAFKLRLAEKDLRLVLEAAGLAGVDVAGTRATCEQFARAVALGHGDDDMAATYFAARGG